MTGYFVGRLDLYELAGWNGEWYCLLEDFTFVDVDGTAHTALAGTLTNFASVPRFLWSLFPPIGKHTRASVVHDYQCQFKPMDSASVHALFRRMLWACELRWWNVYVFWGCVRLFGPRFHAVVTASTAQHLT